MNKMCSVLLLLVSCGDNSFLDTSIKEYTKSQNASLMVSNIVPTDLSFTQNGVYFNYENGNEYSLFLKSKIDEQNAITNYKNYNEEYSNSINRDGLNLIITTQSGKFLILKDDDTESNNDYVKYRFIKYISELNLLLIEKNYYEDKNYILVNFMDGRIYEFRGYPIFSPNFQHMISCDNMEEKGYWLDLFTLNKDIVYLDASISFENEESTFTITEPFWVTNERAKIIKNYFNPEKSKYAYKEGYVEVNNSNWKIY